MVFVARRGVFLEREIISKEDSGSKIDLEEIQESTDEETIVNTDTQQEDDKISDSTLSELDEPANYKEAMASLEAARWKEAMKSEIQSMLVANGYTQTHEIDYEETFSPVAKIKSIRIMLAIDAFHDYEIWQMDVKTVFLNRKLTEDVFMAQPEDFKNTKFKMENSKKGNLPLHHGIKISKDLCLKTDKEVDKMSRVLYASAIRSIMYAMTYTRPDVSFALSMVSQHQQNLGEGHWMAQIDKDDSRLQSGWVFLPNEGAVTWNCHAVYDDDDDDMDYTIALTPVLATKEPDNSLSMGDEHLDTIPATESDEVIKSSVKNLVPIPSEFKGIPDTLCDVHRVNNPTLLEAKDQFEIVINSNNDYSSSDDDSLYYENIEYVEASPHDSEFVSLEVEKIVIPEDEEIEDDHLREKLSKVDLLIAEIEAFKDNPTPSSEFLTKRLVVDHPTICYNDDDDEDCTIAITPILSSKEPDNSLSMGDEHLDTILATESDEFIKSSVENLVSIPNQFEDFSYSNDDSTSIDDDSFSIDNVEYVEASPPDFELVSSEVMEIVILEVRGIDEDILLTIKDDILREKLLNINLLNTKIKALKDNPTSSFDFMTKSSSTSLNFLLEETNTFDNSLPESESFCFDSEENSSGSTTTRSDICLPNYEAFYDDQVKEISSGGTTTHSDFSVYDSFIFDLLINLFPPADRSDFYEFANELAHIISSLEYDCFSFKNEPNSGEFTMDVVEDIFPTREPRVHVHNVLPTHPTLQLNLDFILSSESLFAYVLWIFLPFLSYSVAPQYLLSFGNEDTIFDPGISNYHLSLFYAVCISSE
nr:hypothetical protein [Tanacetum cinerariifolium]